MKLQDIKDIFQHELGSLYPAGEIRSFFYQLVEHYLGTDRFILVLQPQYVISKQHEQLFFEALSRLRQQQPIQYITGKAHFFDLELTVNSNVLIPRPETEELVSWIIGDSLGSSQPNPSILDVGCGSGCIAIALAKKLEGARVSAMDVSAGALDVARQNAAHHAVNINFMQADILADLPWDGQWDLIVSNPPYIREVEQKSLPVNVRKYEPPQALFVPDKNPLLFYEHIADLAIKRLPLGGALYFEINQYLGPETVGLLEERNFSEIELRKDMFGNDRMVKAIRP